MYLDYLKAVLPCEDTAATKNFYENVLVLPKENENTFHAGKTGHVEIAEVSPCFAEGPTAMWVEANLVDRTYANAKANGELNMIIDITDTYYGAREFEPVDPSGNIMAVINYSKDLDDPARAASDALYAEEFRVVFYVKNMGAVYKFYTEVLGLKDVYHWEENRGDRGFKYELAEGSKNYIETLFREPLSVQKQGTLVLKNTDPEAEYNRIKGICPKAVYGEYGKTYDGTEGFTLRDPEGNFVIIQKG